MTADDLRKRFPNASKQFVADNADDLPPTAIMECGVPAQPLAADAPKARHTGKYIVRVTSFRRRLLDEDNLCEKFHVDALRFAGILPSDAASFCRIITTQEKVRSKDEERTEIVISAFTVNSSLQPAK